MSNIRRIVLKKQSETTTDDTDFWSTKSHQERLDALEAIRKEYHQWKYDAEPRFQRVCRVIKRTRS